MTKAEQIMELEQDLLLAMLNSDVQKLDELISDELIFTNHLGMVLNKASDIDTHQSGNLNFDYIEPSEQFIEIYNDTAVVSVLMDIKGSFLDEPFRGKSRYTRIWFNREDSWKIVAAHSSMVHY